jgi:PAS domain S-box-containing protein
MYRSKIDGSAFIELNAKFAEMLGYSREEMLGTAGRIRWANVAERDDMMKRLMEKGGFLSNYEARVLSKNGEVVHVIASIKLNKDGGTLDGTMVDITERKRAEAALKESERKFHDTITYLDEGYYCCTMDGTLIDHNLAFNRILGIDIAKDMRCSKLPDFWQKPEDRMGYLKELIESGSIKNYLINVKTIDKKKAIVMASSHLVKDDKGQPIKIEGVFLDITDRVIAENALREANANLEARVIERTTELNRTLSYNRGLIEASVDPFVTIGPDGKITDVNKATEEATGVIRNSLIGSDFASYFTEPEKAQAGYEQVFDKGYVHDFPLALKNASGAVMDVLYNAVTFNDETGNVQGVFAAARDVTDRKRAQEELQRIEGEQRIILDSIPAWVFYKDCENRFVRVNNAFSKVMGIPREQLEGKSLYELYPKEQADAFLRDDLAVIESGKPKVNIVEPMTSGGSTLWALTDKIPYRDAQGKILGIIGFTVDITELKKAENKIKELNERLNENLKHLESTNKELESFAYSVSHDLRTPLRAIDGFSKKITDGYERNLDDEGKRLLGVIRENTRTMGKLIDDLLSFSRIGRQEIKKTKIEMKNIVTKAMKDLANDASGRKIELVVGDLPIIQGDRPLMSQAIVNLLSNAIKFTKNRAVANIEVSGRKEGDEIIYSVKDNGAGFDMKYVGKLFGVFQRLHTANEFEGTGVGLAIVQRIIHKHGGRVWAEGKVNEGATFYFALPESMGIEEMEGTN